jgi:hypothetical protein
MPASAPTVIRGKLGMHRRHHPDDREGEARLRAELARAVAREEIRRMAAKRGLSYPDIAAIAMEEAAES